MHRICMILIYAVVLSSSTVADEAKTCRCPLCDGAEKRFSEKYLEYFNSGVRTGGIVYNENLTAALGNVEHRYTSAPCEECSKKKGKPVVHVIKWENYLPGAAPPAKASATPSRKQTGWWSRLPINNPWYELMSHGHYDDSRELVAAFRRTYPEINLSGRNVYLAKAPLPDQKACPVINAYDPRVLEVIMGDLTNVTVTIPKTCTDTKGRERQLILRWLVKPKICWVWIDEPRIVVQSGV